MTGFAAAQDAQTAREALERLVAPPGGHLRKRRGLPDSYVTLNAYVGVGGGVEWLAAAPRTGARVRAATWPTLQIGPEVGARFRSLGSAADATHAWSLGLQVQLLDLGTVAQWRLGATETTELPDLRLQHVFAPGANVAVALPRAPVSVLLSAGSLPELREIEEKRELDLRPVTAWRFGLGLVVDVPLLD